MLFTPVWATSISHIQVLGRDLMLRRNNRGWTLIVLIFHLPTLNAAEIRGALLPRRGS
jgi:hypothetical protein